MLEEVVIPIPTTPEEERRKKQKDLILSIIFGQVISFVVALSAVFTKILNDFHHVSSPALQNIIGYSLTCLLALYPCYPDMRTDVNRKIVFSLFLVAIADSQAAFFDNLAYNYSVSIASVGMLSSFTIPCVMFLSYCFLHVKYLPNHFYGTTVALVGLVCVILADVIGSNDNVGSGTGNTALNSSVTKINTTGADSSPNNDQVIGDLLIIVGSAFYATSNVATEAFVKARSMYVYLAWLGFFCALISIVQFLATEVKFWNTFQAKEDEQGIITWSFILNGLTFTFVYFGAAKFFSKYDAVVFNLSLLTTDVWGILFGYFFFDEEISFLKILGFFAVVLGVYLYNSKPPSVNRKTISEEHQVPLQPLSQDEEAEVSRSLVQVHNNDN